MRNAGQINKVPDYNSSNFPVKILHRENWDDRCENRLTVMSEQRRRRRQRKLQKSNWFRLAKRASRFFVDFFAVIARLRRKIPNFTFFGGLEPKTTTSFFFSWTLIQSFTIPYLDSSSLTAHAGLARWAVAVFDRWSRETKTLDTRMSLLEFNSRKNCQHLTNWTRWNKRDKVWSSATSLFKWRFRSRRRLCCLSSLKRERKTSNCYHSITRTNIPCTQYKLLGGSAYGNGIVNTPNYDLIYYQVKQTRWVCRGGTKTQIFKR